MTFKDSGIEWLGEIPEHWEVVKIKHIFSIGRGRVISQEELDKNGKFPVYSSQTTNNGILGYIKTYDYDCEQITWTTDGVNAGTIFLRSGKYNCTNICGILKPKRDENMTFLAYAIQNTTPYYKRPDTNGAKIMNNEMANIEIVYPPIEEQKAIADFLDSKCKQIESFVDKKQKLIALLNEKKQALINECVTKGLSALCHCKALTRHSKDSPSCHSEALAEESTLLCHSERSEESKNIETQDTESRCFAIAQHDRTEYKDSGIEHLGKIPSHWEVRRLATFGKFSKGGNISRQDLVENGEQALLYGDIYMNYEISTSFLDSKISENTSLGATPIYRGDILFAGSGETKEDIGKNIVYLGNDRAFVGGDVIIFRQKENNALFLSYALNTKYAKFYKGIESKGEIIVHIYASNLKDIKIPLPPIEEQKQIAEFLDSEISKIDSIMGKIKKQIELIKEYKATLINQTVCGRIDLQGGNNE